jgi:hypothetical protein
MSAASGFAASACKAALSASVDPAAPTGCGAGVPEAWGAGVTAEPSCAFAAAVQIKSIATNVDASSFSNLTL